MKIRIYKDSEHSSIIFICAYLILNEVNALVQNVFSLSDQVLSNIRIIIMIILALLIVYMVSTMSNTMVYSFIIVELLVVFLYLYSYILGVSFSVLGEWMITTLPVCVPIMFAAMQIKDFEYFYSILIKVSWVLLVLLILDMLGGRQTNLYDMHFSYVLLLVILLHISRIFDGKQVYFIFSLIEILVLLAYGSRGALACIAVYIVLRIVFSNIKTYRKIVYSCIIVMLVGLFFIFIDNFGQLLYQFLSEIGFYNRTLQLILNGELITHDSGRIQIWANTISLIQEEPLFGWGIRGAIDKLGAPYPHNLFLDLWLSFGIIFGSVLIIALLWSIVKGIFFSQDGRGKDVFLLFFSHAFIFLIFSGTIFTSYYFFILLGLAFNKNITSLNNNQTHTRRHYTLMRRHK